MGRVKIVATLGPATSSREHIAALIEAGVDVLRLNFSHGNHEDHQRLVRTVRQVADGMDRQVALLQDLQGPKIRTGPLRSGPLPLQPGGRLVITTEPMEGEGDRVSTSYPRLHEVLAPGHRVLLDDGRLEVQVETVRGPEVITRVVKGGLLGANKGINLPHVPVDLPSLTEKDQADLEFGLDLGIDWVALSFVRRAADVQPVQAVMRRRRMQVPVLAKIEKPEALEDLHAILEVFDGVMVARGDLGVELSPEQVPLWQKAIIRRARALGKVSIVATQMLESMMQSPRPTRAEASDVANAVLDGTDAVMLSGETAVGAYPVEAVAMMKRIIAATEQATAPQEVEYAGRIGSARAVARAACSLAKDLHARAVVVLTRSGMSARLVSWSRPPVPVLALTREPQIARQLALLWGITPLVTPVPASTEAAFQAAEETLLQRGAAEPGDDVIVVGAAPLTTRGRTNFLKVHRVGGRVGDVADGLDRTVLGEGEPGLKPGLKKDHAR